MNHKIVTAVVGLIIVLFVASAFGFAWAVQVRAPQTAGRADAALVPHPVNEDTKECVGCHVPSTDRIPPTHRYYTSETCLTCHDWRPLRSVPHAVSMGDARCVLCHGDPGQDLGMPRSHLLYTEKRCSFCHAPDPEKVAREPKPAGESLRVKPNLTHPVTDAFENCLYCHRVGGTPSLPESHVAFEQETCTWCHVAAPESSEATF